MTTFIISTRIISRCRGVSKIGFLLTQSCGGVFRRALAMGSHLQPEHAEMPCRRHGPRLIGDEAPHNSSRALRLYLVASMGTALAVNVHETTGTKGQPNQTCGSANDRKRHPGNVPCARTEQPVSHAVRFSSPDWAVSGLCGRGEPGSIRAPLE